MQAEPRLQPFPFNKYRPEKILGAGGFGVLFLCKNVHLGGPVVVKALQPHPGVRRIEDVFTEARALEVLQHPAIIRVRDCDFADNDPARPYLVMDYFDGLSLDEHVRQHGLFTPSAFVPIARAISEGLRAAHAAGVLHRDVKPGNVLVRRAAPLTPQPPLPARPLTPQPPLPPKGERGSKSAPAPPSAPKVGEGGGGGEGAWEVKLIDFGLAVGHERDGDTAPPAFLNTPPGGFLGTYDYAAPEQAGTVVGVTVGTYSDVYGFGRTCYYALLGTPVPDDFEKAQLPPAWRSLLAECTARLPERRLADFEEVLRRLARL